MIIGLKGRGKEEAYRREKLYCYMYTTEIGVIFINPLKQWALILRLRIMYITKTGSNW